MKSKFPTQQQYQNLNANNMYLQNNFTIFGRAGVNKA